MSPPGSAVVAVLDDEPAYRQALSRLLRAHDLKVQTFASASEFFAATVGQSFACLLLDLHLPDRTGFDVLTDLKSQGTVMPVIMITGHDQPGSAATAHSATHSPTHSAAHRTGVGAGIAMALSTTAATAWFGD